MKGVGVFFNQMYDLERIETLTKPTSEAPNGYIDWIAPIMAPDQESVQLNRKEWKTWRARMPHVKYLPWFVCDDPAVDIERAEYVCSNYTFDGTVWNCEKAYESTGKWKGRTLCEYIMASPSIAAKPKILSSPSTPAERYDMDYRSFERIGMTFAPQAYWLDPEVVASGTDARPQRLYQSMYLPLQIHVGRDYRIQILGVADKRWGRVVARDALDQCTIKDMRTSKLYRCPVVPMEEGNYKYMHVKTGRELLDYATGKVVRGKVLGFQVREKIMPTVGVYPACDPAPDKITYELQKIQILKGASLYLGDTSESEDVKAVWRAVYQ